MRLDRFVQIRPTLYHLTAASNWPRIEREGRLDAASTILAAAARTDLLRSRRPESERVVIGADTVHIRDQTPLYEGNCDLGDGLSFADLVELLNGFVYFWPGTETGPTDYGRRHFQRYAGREDVVVLSVPTAELIAANPDRLPHFSRFNSGSPRCHPRAGKSPRGADTFLPADRFERSPGAVVEVVFKESIRLPIEHVNVRPATDWIR